jgi:hypothetical protein
MRDEVYYRDRMIAIRILWPHVYLGCWPRTVFEGFGVFDEDLLAIGRRVEPTAHAGGREDFTITADQELVSVRADHVTRYSATRCSTATGESESCRGRVPERLPHV